MPKITKHIIIEDSPENMANVINDICRNKDRYVYIGENAKKLILENGVGE